jgi:uncharacterized membrane protein
MIRAAYLLACTSWIALTLLCVAWEGFLAPLRPGGSLMTLKALPLLVPLFGLLRERLYSYRWSSLLVLAYFTEGAVRAWSDMGMSRALAVGEATLSVVYFGACLLYIRTRLAAGLRAP